MQAEQIKALLESHIENAEVTVAVDGSHVNVEVVSPVFEGLNAVKKQQMVYGALSDQIADGSIHAVNMKTYTPEQKAKL
ncbi:MAG: BolA/IbaG family iron-sulfur metabolism protein [Pseudomonadota bacterium]|jgi:acid stress-induced BolA-like protein IbaG/YrbA